MKTYPLRTRFARDIVTEFRVPLRLSRRVIILCDGMPSVPSPSRLLDFFWKKGYWVFRLRYRGTWESGGRFLARSPHEDILAVIDGLRKSFVSIADKRKFTVTPEHIFIIGQSFGGTAAILSLLDARVDKVVALSPVVDWKAPSKVESLDWLYYFVREGFGEGYRFRFEDWRKLISGKFFNPQAHVRDIDGSKLMILHARDDNVVLFGPVKRFAQRVGCELMLLKRGGHAQSSWLLQKRIYRHVRGFLLHT
ncbi:MAG: hypothetical protein A3B74_00935 [Candidatus Kerfeldbacteria bacterium RIFCSPHIGHO2_02_FULL_42_14]|uniref:Peptidase S9 prolyl oligopeptidase catalytic domain-containing protein n=1 Tax=Candidatus Kerfeldbacteria bacterium RIFCSPHIGHO2_02_FULL_42_14 TaxID=1798540 RepID=A0A1G2ATP0_9BACT|nr:MAG: hypothetical protein A3B74_00935 [Candidatus Kerfeldbacteria bacterium RIFCSPHIGHO2_02_FULL_42_14]OGY81918.1 MAG: hypothetical protein A3E60_01015 [Candidatus Kerfeldbacteria bacterium RIFCSPHIGHO2_12_FULL_42_13]OGY83447.1 MAG: hypothetical protein A3I91_02240 [Candidatus Kerfeldbacteria bacterium RIFCSPLOWO2_02_FULL_42_19]OGY87027.1 MAG: hypothetical protein A3G01_01970 [Candidatus Kerfeldbacteria bacterium RIFCSPLOWO2_12_FULL_43_9]